MTLYRGGSDVSNATGGVANTAQELLDKIKTVDGEGSGLDADLLKGNAPTATGITYLTGSTGFVEDNHVSTGTKLYNRINDAVSVKDYGAKGDGVTDDTAAFTNACAAATSSVLVPGDTNYAIAGTLTLPADVLLIYTGTAQLVTSGSGTITRNGSEIRLNANTATDTAAAASTDFMPSGTFSGTWKTAHKWASSDATTPFSGSRSTAAFTRVVAGSGSNNPNSDHALFVVAKKDDLSGTTAGEIGALRGLSFQNAWGDSSTALFGGYKKVGNGSVDEGALTTIETTVRRFTTDLSTYDHWMNNIIGFSPNPTSTWGGRGPIGFYSENHEGGGFANFVGITDGAEGAAGTMSYLIAGFRSRDLASRYFSVTSGTGDLESLSNDAGAGAGPTWRLTRASASPAANDVLGQIYWRGKDSAGNDTDYVRAFSFILDPTDGSEDGAWELRTLVGGTETMQLRARNGLGIGIDTTLGTGSVNIASVLGINSVTVLDASRGIRHRSYSSTDIANAAHAVNTTDKVAGKTIWDSTNNRLLTAGGSAATDTWYVANGTAAINPA